MAILAKALKFATKRLHASHESTFEQKGKTRPTL